MLKQIALVLMVGVSTLTGCGHNDEPEPGPMFPMQFAVSSNFGADEREIITDAANTWRTVTGGAADVTIVDDSPMAKCRVFPDRLPDGVPSAYGYDGKCSITIFRNPIYISMEDWAPHGATYENALKQHVMRELGHAFGIGNLDAERGLMNTEYTGPVTFDESDPAVEEFFKIQQR